MNEERTHDSASRPSERRIDTGNCTILRTARSARENTPVCLSSGTIATLLGNESNLQGAIYSNDVAEMTRGSHMERGVALDMVNSDVIRQKINDDFQTQGSSVCAENERQRARPVANSEFEISTSLGEAFANNLNSKVANQEELRNSKEMKDSKRSFRIVPNRSKIVPRKYSLPSRLSKLSINKLAEMVIKNSAMHTGVNNRLTLSPHATASSCNESSVVAVTPPPSYRSLINQNISDSPPSYECVTGLSLNIGQDPLADVQKFNSRNQRAEYLERQSKILIILVVLIVLLVTVALALAEAFTV